jgi:hypothetical protein
MRAFLSGLFVVWLASGPSAYAVVNYSTGTNSPTYNTAAPTGSNIANWTTGWTQPSPEPTGYTYTTGWNYVGYVNNANGVGGGVYIGNGWVLTASHVIFASSPSTYIPSTFYLNGVVYQEAPDTVQVYYNTSGTYSGKQADVIAFRLTTWPNLPALPIRTSDPVASSNSCAMIGYGDGAGHTTETWGYNLVNYINEPVNSTGSSYLGSSFSYFSNDFLTLEGADSGGNVYNTVTGDSGGGVFIYNSTSRQWELAGIMNVSGTAQPAGPSGPTDPLGGFVQLDTYYSQLQQLANWTPPIDSPTMPQWGLILLGLVLVFAAASQLADTRRA